MIRLDGVTKRYGDKTVLRGIDFTVPQGQVACLIGPSGSGKSTVLRAINGLERHDKGTIEVDGVPVTDANLSAIRRKVAMVFQRFNLLPHRTVLENVIEGPVHVLREPRDAAEAHAMALLDQVGLADRANAMPSQLSGGQQQRVGIARALAMRPQAILFDEPTSALDPERVGEVLQVMRALAQSGMTMIVVTHEIAFAREVGDRAIFMADGVVVEDGPAREVLTAPRAPRTRQFLDRVLNPL
ncbi:MULTISPECIES: amino acid ABC transporter ATP-binding protein [unclassified Novosphingobium]|uniref:amino acid ABC transporter ATP-binding protein n=1 Tax=unclassified Novosphingobium TaxID=2644732 RepID=UPI001494B638|nr:MULTISPECIES: amino acid ABC transporter ATP-binding protein [unclassified Novosphingobium]MBB3359880.1 polar amino acid transport system ATP-binding protein [Novosphingobium sp. BK256]MBB3376239.1 polar amino acid transport system ATP-binding protein [Novosphingobium sp. BK280]MBB3380653.1 polar amino acid transport system ATP-binding protein [Novosphingobium sp. BK258]MBB3422351.1 polar amino acid transport system ATP-binding protein [Novosphingobium sp. BK267]MBB3451051.1 polar amino aci